MTLSWCEPGPGPDDSWSLVGYNIVEGTSSGGESTQANGSLLDSATSSYTVSGLTNGTTYYFQVEGVTQSGTPSGAPSASTPPGTSSFLSNEVSATPEATSSVPGAPSGLRADPGDSQVTLSWTAPEPVGGSLVTGYDIYLGRSQGGESESPIDQVTGTSADITGLSNGISYYFVVRADSAAGKSDPSNEALAVPVAAGSGGTNHGGPGSGGHHHAGPPAQPGRPGWWTLAAGGGGILVIVVVILHDPPPGDAAHDRRYRSQLSGCSRRPGRRARSPFTAPVRSRRSPCELTRTPVLTASSSRRPVHDICHHSGSGKRPDCPVRYG